MSSILGIDVSKAKLDVYLLLAEAEVHQANFANDSQGFQKLAHWLKKRKAGQVHACLEATSVYSWDVAAFLDARQHRVSVVNPARIKAYARSQLQRNKTDKLDAAVIADFCRTQVPPLWTPPTEQEKRLLALLRHYDDLSESLQQARNRLGTTQNETVVNHLQTQIDLLQQQMRDVQQYIEDHFDQHPELKRQRDLLTTIPGLGKLTASKLLAELHDIRHFDDVRQVVAFAGLNPKQRQSGRKQAGYTSISKTGSATLRAALYLPAVVAMRHNPILAAFAQRLRQRGLRGKAVVVAVMRKLLHLVFGILKSGNPFDPHHLEKIPAMA
jgi:transposase